MHATRPRVFILAACLLTVTAAVGDGKARRGKGDAAGDAANPAAADAGAASISVLNERVAALESLDSYAFTQSQLQTLRQMARDADASELPPAALPPSRFSSAPSEPASNDTVAATLLSI